MILDHIMKYSVIRDCVALLILCIQVHNSNSLHLSSNVSTNETDALLNNSFTIPSTNSSNEGNTTEYSEDDEYYNDELMDDEEDELDYQQYMIGIVLTFYEIYGTLYGLYYGAYSQMNYFFHVYVIGDYKPQHLVSTDNITLSDFD